MTRLEVEKIAAALGDERYGRWVNCPSPHGYASLPSTDSGELYCPNCMTLFDATSKATLNIPERARPANTGEKRS